MLEDVTAARPTEVELINGSLVRAGERAGLDAPLHNAIYRLVQGREGAYG
jgi:ketopantoate reductase